MSNPSHHAVAADVVFDGTELHRDAAVVIDGATIQALVSRADLPQGLPARSLPIGAWLVPGFIDVQVNGGGDVLFNDTPTPACIRTIAAAHRSFGTSALLPTLISDSRETMEAALDAVENLVGREPSVLGIHLEGPFLSPEKAGAHDPSALRTPTEDDLRILTMPRRGRMLVTLAPEVVPPGFIGQLVAAGIHVSLGHSMATYEQACAAVAEGATGFTHLFNAMRPLASRDPGLTAAALENPACSFGLIVDGVHVAPPVLRLALRGEGRPMLVTDAMPPVGGMAGNFTLGGQEVIVKDGQCRNRDGTLAGTCLDMATAVRNCVRLLDVSLERALRFASLHPAMFIGLGDRLGRLAAGYRADMVALVPDGVRVLQTWVAGKTVPRA